MKEAEAARYPLAGQAARALHGRHGLPFPLNVSHLLERIKSHRIYDLSSRSYNAGVAQSESEMLCPQTAWTIFNDMLDTYLIVWNPAHTPEGIRYFVAHELGHILLNHERAWPTDRVLTKRHKEREANAFARFLLAPPERVHEVCGGVFDTRLVAARFGISRTVAAQVRADHEHWMTSNKV